MKPIYIDDEVYNHVLRNSNEIGEDASSILRRLLGLRSACKGTDEVKRTNLRTSERSSIDDCLDDHLFKKERDAVGRFLVVLAWLHRKHPSDFHKVLDIRGRRRLYFAKSPTTLEESGNSIMPQRIPGSDFYVATNNDTPKKKRILNDVLRVLGYSQADCNRLSAALGI